MPHTLTHYESTEMGLGVDENSSLTLPEQIVDLKRVAETSYATTRSVSVGQR